MKSKINKKLSQAFTILKGELHLNFSIWLIQTIITGSVMLFLLIICFLLNLNTSQLIFSFLPSKFSSENIGANLFISLFTEFLFITGILFSIIYIAKSLSYLYNKRKLDMYGSMPITRRYFFNSKVFASFVMSVMVFAAFAVVMVIIGACTGATFENYEIQRLILFIFMVLFIVSLYSLCAVCSKGTLNAIISLFIIVNFIPVAAVLVKYVFNGFFAGINTFLIPVSAVINIFSLPADGNLIYIVVWVILGALLLVLSNLFIKKRNPENTKRMFVMPILEYAIKIILTLIAGLLIGLLVGALSVNNGFIGFIAGFIIAAIPTYIVIHVIYNKGFSKLLKSSIALCALIILSMGFFWFCEATPMQINNTVPNKEDISSAGMIDLQTPVTEINADLILGSVADFTEDKYIDKIVNFHQEAASMQLTYTTSEKCRLTLINMLLGTVNDVLPGNIFDHEGFIITYKFNNGFVNSYYYPNECQYDFSNSFLYSSVNTLYENENICNLLAELEITEKYREKYRPLFTNPDLINSFEISYNGNDYNSGQYYESKELYEDTLVKNTKFDDHYKKLSDAFITDLKNDKNAEKYNKPFLPSISNYYYYDNEEYYDDDSVANGNDFAELNYSDAENEIQYSANTNNTNSDIPFYVTFHYKTEGFYYVSDMYYIPKSYTNTIKALKEIGAINDDLTINYFLNY